MSLKTQWSVLRRTARLPRPGGASKAEFPAAALTAEAREIRVLDFKESDRRANHLSLNRLRADPSGAKPEPDAGTV